MFCVGRCYSNLAVVIFPLENFRSEHSLLPDDMFSEQAKKRRVSLGLLIAQVY